MFFFHCALGYLYDVIVFSAAYNPPEITKNPEAELPYKSQESVTLECQARGDPTPV